MDAAATVLDGIMGILLASVRKYATEANASEASDHALRSDTTRASSSTETKGASQEKLKSEPGLDSKVTLTPIAVTLSGSVASSQDRDKAMRIARLYAGDRQVEDHLSGSKA